MRTLIISAAAALLFVGGAPMVVDSAFKAHADAAFCASISDSLSSGTCHNRWTYTLDESSIDELDDDGWGQLRTGVFVLVNGNCREIAERTASAVYIATNPGGHDVPAQSLYVDITQEKLLGAAPSNCSS